MILNDSIVEEMNRKNIKLLAFVIFLDNLFMLNISFEAGAGAASRYGSGSTEMIRLLAAPTTKHWASFNPTTRLFH
jgi:hypothetical protein